MATMASNEQKVAQLSRHFVKVVKQEMLAVNGVVQKFRAEIPALQKERKELEQLKADFARELKLQQELTEQHRAELAHQKAKFEAFEAYFRKLPAKGTAAIRRTTEKITTLVAGVVSERCKAAVELCRDDAHEVLKAKTRDLEQGFKKDNEAALQEVKKELERHANAKREQIDVMLTKLMDDVQLNASSIVAASHSAQAAAAPRPFELTKRDRRHRSRGSSLAETTERASHFQSPEQKPVSAPTPASPKFDFAPSNDDSGAQNDTNEQSDPTTNTADSGNLFGDDTQDAFGGVFANANKEDDGGIFGGGDSTDAFGSTGGDAGGIFNEITAGAVGNDVSTTPQHLGQETSSAGGEVFGDDAQTENDVDANVLDSSTAGAAGSSLNDAGNEDPDAAGDGEDALLMEMLDEAGGDFDDDYDDYDEPDDDYGDGDDGGDDYNIDDTNGAVDDSAPVPALVPARGGSPGSAPAAGLDADNTASAEPTDTAGLFGSSGGDGELAFGDSGGGNADVFGGSTNDATDAFGANTPAPSSQNGGGDPFAMSGFAEAVGANAGFDAPAAATPTAAVGATGASSELDRLEEAFKVAIKAEMKEMNKDPAALDRLVTKYKGKGPTGPGFLISKKVKGKYSSAVVAAGELWATRFYAEGKGVTSPAPAPAAFGDFGSTGGFDAAAAPAADGNAFGAFGANDTPAPASSAFGGAETPFGGGSDGQWGGSTDAFGGASAFGSTDAAGFGGSPDTGAFGSSGDAGGFGSGNTDAFGSGDAGAFGGADTGGFGGTDTGGFGGGEAAFGGSDAGGFGGGGFGGSSADPFGGNGEASAFGSGAQLDASSAFGGGGSTFDMDNVDKAPWD
eukprot:INCI11094.1.p1 GENE.INCI11094.1~~INCI11094.1.p1  ORF type:complete len:850 (+),score=253.54 INCI11094.1:141-2690(+)